MLLSVYILAISAILRGLCEGRPQPKILDQEPERTGVCAGTDITDFSHMSSKKRYELYKEHYTGCKQVKGDVVLMKLIEPSDTYDMSFLNDIEEINGFLLIQAVLAEEIPLLNLKTIKGKRLYKNFYAVFVDNNFMAPSKGLRELQMPKLKSIYRGDVKIGRNPNLCFMDAIEWGYFMKEQAAVLDKTSKPGDLATSDRCGRCHANCQGFCWGKGPDMCQEITTIFLSRDNRQSDKESTKECKNKSNCSGGSGSNTKRRPCSGNNRVRCRSQKQLRNQTPESYASSPPTAPPTTMPND